MKKYSAYVFYLISFFYWEFIFRYFVFHNFLNYSLINIIFYGFFWSGLCFLITKLFSIKYNQKIFHTILCFFGIWFSAQFCVHNLFGFFYSLNLSAATGQVFQFMGTIISLVLKNIIFIIAFMVPFILSSILNTKINYEKASFKKIITYLEITLMCFGIFTLSLLINKNNYYSPYNLTFNRNDIGLSIENLGVIDAANQDAIKYFTKFKENLETAQSILIEPKSNVKYNNLNLEFQSNNEQMNNYFENETGTEQNEYTGYFKNKNLILFMAESFNEIAVSEELTPTLYKLVHNGFYFTNYYTPTIDSTIGGEFQELTGLYPGNGFLANWKSGTNYFPYGIGTSFQNLGYNTYAYHDHDYTFQNRNKYLESLGFNNFEACGNGLEAKVNCHVWPESDLEMIKGTVSDYASSDKPFMVYYATVSGHGDYTWTTQSSKHKDEVNNLNYSSKVLAYLAANIELNNALEELINELQENGKLDDTVIVLTGDHYPYFLSADEVNEVSSYYKDPTVEINHSNLIIWNNKMTSKEINKVGSEIDVLPTVYNLFNVPYDSRIIIGKDILSNEPGLAMFGNRSWVSDLGTFYAGSNTFIAKENVIIPDDYLKIMNEKVNNKINMSGLIMKTNYYRQITEK